MGEEKKNKKGTKSAEERLLEMFPSRTEVLWRSRIHLSGYNPRLIDAEARKLLKRSLKTYGVVGGIIVNERTGYTVVSGHQKIGILDEMRGYSEGNPAENDYQLKVEVVDMDEKQEKRFNIMLNSPSAQGYFDDFKMRPLLAEIGGDFADAGLTDNDVALFGVDFTVETENERAIAAALAEVGAPVAAQKAAQKELNREERIAHNKEVKQQVLEGAAAKASQMDAYVTISFETFEAKAAFMERFGYSPGDKFLKGEVFENQVERIA